MARYSVGWAEFAPKIVAHECTPECEPECSRPWAKVRSFMAWHYARRAKEWAEATENDFKRSGNYL